MLRINSPPIISFCLYNPYLNSKWHKEFQEGLKYTKKTPIFREPNIQP